MLMKKNLILLKIIFLINLVCKDLTFGLCEHSQNVWDFFLNLSKQYNKAIEGLNSLKENFKKEEENI